MKYWLKNSFAALTLASTAISTAQAQATRTWVSGVGDDANPCSRTAPCKTFAGAISKTAAGGEISVLDPGGFGAVTITKSITINGDGTLAGILATGGTNGVVVNATNTDVIRLRNISISGARTGLNGIRFLAGNTLELDNVSIYGFTTHGIDVNLSTNDNRNLLVKNSSISDVASNGVNISGITGITGQFSAVLDHVSVQRAANRGIISSYAQATTIVSNSVIAQTASGVHADIGEIALERSSLNRNKVAVQAGANGKVWIMDNDMFNNTTLFVGCTATTLFTNQNNRTGGNDAVGCEPSTPVDLK